MFSFSYNKSSSIIVRCLQFKSPSLHKVNYCRHRSSYHSGNHKQSQKVGRIAAISVLGVKENEGISFEQIGENKRNTDNKNYKKINYTSSNNEQEEEQIPIAGPASPQAYLYRMRNGRFESLITLLSTPYTPSPLKILTDILSEVQRLKLSLSIKENEEKEKEEEEIEAFKRMTNALSDPLAIRHIFHKSINILKESSEAATVVGDRLSERELQKELQEVEDFVEQLRQWNTNIRVKTKENSFNKNLNYQNLLNWNLSDVVMGEIWHAILEICSITGAFKLAIESLNYLIDLSELLERANTNKKKEINQDEDKEDDLLTFSLDGVVKVVEEEAKNEFRPVTALDHIRAIQSCKLTREFDIAYSLFQRYMQHAQSGNFPLTSKDITFALVALAECCGNASHFNMLQELFIKSEAANVVEVSVELYTALIDAVSRADSNPKRMNIALALYRRLRDGNFKLISETYAALIACCASTREPTQAFAFYHEAKQVCGIEQFTPTVYTNLLLSFARAGYGADARKMLEVLIEAGAPLTRGAFHTVMSCAITLRECEEVMEMMEKKYKIIPTPHSYSYLIKAGSSNPNGVSTVLRMFDWHELALKSLLESGIKNKNNLIFNDSQSIMDKHLSNHTALSSNPIAITLEEEILTRYPMYSEAVESALIRLRVDPMMDPRLEIYMRPLIRIAQLRMNSFIKMSPQKPTLIPKGSAIAVLAADILANIEEWFIPFISNYSMIVIPYSSLVSLRHGSGRRIDGKFNKGIQEIINDPKWSDMGSEQEVIVETRRRILVQFLQKYKDVIHLVSLADELALSRDCDRYGIGVKKTFSRAAAFALNLSRVDIPNNSITNNKLYAEQECKIVLISADFERCGKYIVDLKRKNVFYHNPRTAPEWRPRVSVASLINSEKEEEGEKKEKDTYN